MEEPETLIEDIEVFMLHCHEWSFWNVQLGYAGIPPEFKPIYIPMRMKQEPVPIETLIKHLSADDVTEIVLEEVICRDDGMYVTDPIVSRIVHKLSVRMDYNNKMKLVDEGKADLFWDSEKEKPFFELKEEYRKSIEESESSED